MWSKNLFLVVSWLAFTGLASFVNGQATGDFHSISRAEIELLLQDVAKSNPMLLKRFGKDPAMKKEQLDSLTQLLAFATQAQKDGLADDPINRQELENIRAEVTAVNYDREINKNKGPMVPFGLISEARVKGFWIATPTAKSREIEFQNFMDSKLALLKAGNGALKDREVTEEERAQARDIFAKVRIYDAEYKARHLGLLKSFRDTVDLQVKLQQAQFLSRVYSESIAHKTNVTDAEIEKHISTHPEFDSTKKKAKAEQILNRAKSGEDFAKLANEFSDDPGNDGPNGLKLGGIYRDIEKGKMVPQFELAAISLQPGQVYPSVVETDFGYHVIKLEKKNSTGDLYDARHILISNTYTDPDDRGAAAEPVKTFVRNKLEAEKEKRLLDEIVASNNITVPDDFVIPVLTKRTVTTKKKRPLSKKRPGKR